MSEHTGPERDPWFDGGYVLLAGSGSIVSNIIGDRGRAAETADSVIQGDIADLNLVQGGDAYPPGKRSFPWPVRGLQCFEGDGTLCGQLAGLDWRREAVQICYCRTEQKALPTRAGCHSIIGCNSAVSGSGISHIGRAVAVGSVVVGSGSGRQMPFCPG